MSQHWPTFNALLAVQRGAAVNSCQRCSRRRFGHLKQPALHRRPLGSWKAALAHRDHWPVADCHQAADVVAACSLASDPTDRVGSTSHPRSTWSYAEK